MFGKKVFAAMLATVLGASLFGANVANAVLNLDDDMDAVIYATETLVASTVSELAGYSVVVDSGTDLNVTAAIGLGGPNGTFLTIRFDLGGMVFSTPVMGGNLTTGANHDDASLRSGGQVGDAHVSFIVSRTGNTEAATEMTLAIGQLGVKPGVPGSVTMTVTDSVGDDEEHTASYANAVRTARALQEDAEPLNLTATVEDRFEMFGTETMGSLGSFIVGTNEEYLVAATGGQVAGRTYLPMRVAASRFRVTSRLLQVRGWLTATSVPRWSLRRACCSRKTT